mgnify:CR=1 FL=1
MILLKHTQPNMIIADEGKHIRSIDDVYVPEHTDEEGNPIKIFSDKTCKDVIELMRQVIQDEKIGTGNGYNIEGFDMAAKTGTGEVSVGGSYGNDISTSNIMAAAPANDPKILVYYGFQSPATYVFDKTHYKIF